MKKRKLLYTGHTLVYAKNKRFCDYIRCEGKARRKNIDSAETKLADEAHSPRAIYFLCGYFSDSCVKIWVDIMDREPFLAQVQ